MMMRKALAWFYEHAMWRPTSGRPWTYEIRDWTTRHPHWALAIAFPVTAGFVGGQVMLAIAFDWYALPFVLFADFMAFTAGHLFWDTAGEYIKGKGAFKRGD